MKVEEYRAIELLLESAAYPELKLMLARLGLDALAASWPQFKPMEKLILFKLLDAQSAMDFYRGAAFRDKYFLLCGFPLNTIAPVLEKSEPEQRRLFVQLPREFYDRMFRQLVSERVVMRVPVRNN